MLKMLRSMKPNTYPYLMTDAKNHEINLDFGKIPPQARKYEEAVLGAIMVSKEAFHSSNNLKPEHFYFEAHKFIFQAAKDLFIQNQPIDILTILEKLKSKKQLELIGGEHTLMFLTSEVTSISHIEFYAIKIIERYNLREIIRIAQKAVEQAYYDNADPFEIQSHMINLLENNHISNHNEPEALVKITDKTIEVLKRIQESGLKITGIDTGFRSFNAVGNGWQKSNVIILAARPGVGKTALALNFALNVAKQNIGVAFFSLEMSKPELGKRIISILTGVAADVLKTADIMESDWIRIHDQNFNLPLHIDDTPSLSIIEFKLKARQLKRKHDIQMIVVDYLQLMTAQTTGNRELEISTISRTLKAIAKELNVPILALAQLSRDVEKRSGKPRLSDLRESGSIEQDADIVIFLDDLHSEDKTNFHPTIDAIWAKHRNGSNPIIKLIFDKQKQRFQD